VHKRVAGDGHGGEVAIAAAAVEEAGALHVFDEDAFAAGVERDAVGILKALDQKGLGGLLKGLERAGLPANTGDGLFVGDFAHEALKGEFPDQFVGVSLVAANFAERDGTGAEPAGLFNDEGRGVFFFGFFLAEFFRFLAGLFATGLLVFLALGESGGHPANELCLQRV